MASPAGGANRLFRFLLITLVLLVVGFVVLLRSTYRPPAADEELRLDRLYRLADAGQVLFAALLDEDAVVVGTRCSVVPAPYDPEAAVAPESRCPGEVTSFRVAYPQSDVATSALIERISAQAPLEIEPQGSKAVAKLVLTFIFPLALLANLFGIIFVSKSGESSIGDIIGFGRIARKRQQRKRGAGPGVSFADVAGAEEAVAELREVTEYLTDPKRFEDYGAAAPKGVLLFGPPGCGKTLLARAVAGESGVSFFSISGADFVESLVGVGAARVRDLFSQARAAAPSIVFIDELDAVGRQRGAGVGGGHDEREQTLNEMLVQMDGFSPTEGVAVLAATNRSDILDPALLRAGRFDRHVSVSRPDVEGRLAILCLHARTKRLGDPGADLPLIARHTPGFTGADLANVLNEAALLAVRERAPVVTRQHLDEAVERVLSGPRRKAKLISPEDKQRIAYHEAGHAVVAAALGKVGALSKLSVVARGRGVGHLAVLSEDRTVLTRSDMEAQVGIAMAGLAAEELIFGEPSTGVETDLERATNTARDMAGRYGMTRLGRVRVLQTHGEVFLGRDYLSSKEVSQPTLETLDAEVARILDNQEELARAILVENREALDALARALVAQETLQGPALEAAVENIRPYVEVPDARGGNGWRAVGSSSSQRIT
jgi:cell division protease FtsH